MAKKKRSTSGPIKSKSGLLNTFERCPNEVKAYFEHLPKLVEKFPLDVSLSYVFGRIELGQNMTLYCGIVKLHRAHSTLARNAVDAHHLTREEFRDKFEMIFGPSIPEAAQTALRQAEKVRDTVMHGKACTDDQKRNAIGYALKYAAKINDFLEKEAGFKPYDDLRGFKGRAQSLDKSTTRWVLNRSCGTAFFSRACFPLHFVHQFAQASGPESFFGGLSRLLAFFLLSNRP